MKGSLERVPQRIGVSWRYRKIEESSKSYGWHRHEEYEIAIHRNFSGSCFVGNHISEVSHNHMVLLGYGLPHAIYSDSVEDSKPCETHVIWFRKEWIESLIHLCPELTPLTDLLKDAHRGVQFSEKTTERVVALLGNILDSSPTQQLSDLLAIFGLLLGDDGAVRLINASTLKVDTNASKTHKNLEKIDEYLLSHFNQNIAPSDLADYLFLSESSVRRIFAKHFNESFSQRLKKIRLNVACDMLMNTDLPIGIIIEKVGYDNQANFNRQFKAYKRTTPTQYRLAMKSVR